MVVHGDAGVGKSALLDYVLASAQGCLVVRATGVESEMELAFAGLHQLCAPFIDELPQLPGPQGEALGTALGLRGGPPPDRFLVGLAVLSLLADMAQAQPLVCLVDDAQWFDRTSVQALGFVARRLTAESVVLIFAVRDGWDDKGLTGLAELNLGPLLPDDARDLLDAAIPGRLDDAVRDRILAEAQGNPLALLELPRAWTPAEFAGGFYLPDSISVTSKIEEGFLRSIQPLPEDSRRLLVIAAADPVGDASLLWDAAHQLGISSASAEAAEATGVVDFGTEVRFRHPLVRSVVYREASPTDRRQAHAALAATIDPARDPDRRAWHVAAAAAEPNEEIALELEHSAGRAQARGGVAAGAAFLRRAVELTPDPARRAERALTAAGAMFHAGSFDEVERLVAMAEKHNTTLTGTRPHAPPCFAGRSLSPAAMAVTLRRCCSRRRGSSSASMLRLLAAPTWRPTVPQCRRGTLANRECCLRSAGQPSASMRPTTLRVPLTSYLKAWPGCTRTVGPWLSPSSSARRAALSSSRLKMWCSGVGLRRWPATCCGIRTGPRPSSSDRPRSSARPERSRSYRCSYRPSRSTGCGPGTSQRLRPSLPRVTMWQRPSGIVYRHSQRSGSDVCKAGRPRRPR